MPSHGEPQSPTHLPAVYLTGETVKRQNENTCGGAVVGHSSRPDSHAPFLKETNNTQIPQYKQYVSICCMLAICACVQIHLIPQIPAFEIALVLVPEMPVSHPLGERMGRCACVCVYLSRVDNSAAHHAGQPASQPASHSAVDYAALTLLHLCGGLHLSLAHMAGVGVGGNHNSQGNNDMVPIQASLLFSQ